MKTRSLLLALLLMAGVSLFVGCKPETISITVDETMLIGKWRSVDHAQEYWRYDSNHKGETWDESEDVQEGEGTRFNWSTQDDQLRIDLYGEMGQHVYYDYTVTHQTRDTLVWEDLYGNSRTFIKTNR